MSRHFTIGGHEENVSTKSPKACQQARIPRAHGNTGRSQGDCASQGAWTRAADSQRLAVRQVVDQLRRVRHRLPRRASLKHRKWIAALFDRSQSAKGSLAVGCIRLVFRVVSDVDPSEAGRVFVGFSPGSRIRGAVNRNRVKRLLRECYRREQGVLMNALSGNREALTLMVVYRIDSARPFSEIREDMTRAVASLASRLHS